MRHFFERIVSPEQTQSLELLMGDVRAQVQRLIDSHRISQYRGGVDILNLAVPSVTELGSDSQTDKRAYAAHILKIVRRFEPRLSHVQVKVTEPSKLSPDMPELVIEGQLQVAGYHESFRFVSNMRQEAAGV